MILRKIVIRKIGADTAENGPTAISTCAKHALCVGGADVRLFRQRKVEGPRCGGQVADPARWLPHALTSGRRSPGEHSNRLPSTASNILSSPDVAVQL